ADRRRLPARGAQGPAHRPRRRDRAGRAPDRPCHRREPLMTTRPPASHYIAGAPADDPGGAPIPVLYPATGETIAELHAATPAIVDAAIASAQAGFATWSATPPAERGRVLRRAADIIRARNRELSELETLDTGKPIS